MPAHVNGQHDDPEEVSFYDAMLDLEDMESIVELLEESGVVDEFDPSMLPPDMAELAREAGVSRLSELRALIDARHRELDEEE